MHDAIETATLGSSIAIDVIILASVYRFDCLCAIVNFMGPTPLPDPNHWGAGSQTGRWSPQTENRWTLILSGGRIDSKQRERSLLRTAGSCRADGKIAGTWLPSGAPSLATQG
jgi:hypothetical protein